jgi:dTDP-4-amino-4,6-dideoxygalactose transaminase
MTIGQAAEVSVPLLDLQAQYRPIRDQILAAIVRVCDSQRFILGAENAALESALATQLDTAHAIAVSSGTDALLVAMMALGIGPGTEVITPTYSFFATAGCASRLGATPVFVDVDPVTLNADPAAMAKAITPRTRAILPVHLFGLASDMTPIVEIADRAGVPVIEDAAQAIGARYRGRQVGAFGAVTCYSFFPSKNLGGFGEGGLVTTNDESLAREIRLLRNHGAEPKYFHHRIGGNFRLDELQAAVLRVKAPHLAAWTQGRRRNAERYRTLFRNAGLDAIVLPQEPAGYGHIFNQFVIRTPERDALKRHLDDLKIGNEIYYPVPFHLQPCFADLGYGRGAFPHAERAAGECLAIPIYGELTAAQQQTGVSAIAQFVHRGAGVAR